MAKSCVLRPKVRKANGEITESKLFDNLLFATSNRAKTKEYYSIGTNEEFLDIVRDKAKFDSNGEITMKSLNDLAELNINEEDLIRTLNQEIEAGEYSYEEALSRMQLFNKNHKMNDSYMATITNSNNGKVKLEIVHNNEDNREKLIETINGRVLQDRLKYKLSTLGVEVGFLDKPNINGRYSTENAEKTASGMYNLINIAHGEKGNEALAEETGHFIIGALGNNPLVDRLLNVLTPQMQQSLLGEDKYLELMGRVNPDREVAGYLVGEALRTEPDKTNIVGKLINRIINTAKRIFYKIKGDDISYMKVQARELAEKIADNFMSDSFEGSVDKALEISETLYDADDSAATRTLKKVVKILHAQAIRMKDLQSKNAKTYFQLLDIAQAKSDYVFNPNTPGLDSITINRLLEVLAALPEELKSIQERLATVKIGYDDINSENAKIIREAELFITNTVEIKKIIDNLIAPIEGTSTNLIAEADVLNALRICSGTINQMLSGDDRGKTGLISVVEVKRKEFYAKFLEHGLGSRYVNIAAKKIFKGAKLESISEQKLLLDELLESQDDEGAFHAWMTSMSNAKSITNQIVNRMFRRLKKVANDRVLEVQNQLDVLRSELDSIGGNTREFYEVDPNTNQLTGNFIDKYYWGLIEQEWEELYNTEKKRFYETIDKKGKSRNELALLWHSYFNPIAKRFNDSHFTLDKDGKTLVPVDKYINQVYKNNIEGTPKENWLKKFKSLKKGIEEECLGSIANEHRAPQFKGLTMNKLRNRMTNSSLGKAIGNTIWNNVTETFLEDSEDRDFGGMTTYNPDDQLYTDDIIIEEDKIKRVPLFGINKLKDMNDLSTDMFHSTLAYASMAYRYNISKQFVDILELGKEVMHQTTYSGKVTSVGEKNTSNSYKRLEKFLDKELYGFKTYKLSVGRLVFNKIASFFSRLASKVYLGGNVAGGITNVGTGSVELFKEAVSGEHFTLSDWRRANKEYFKHLPDNMLHMGDLRKFDKISLLIERFDSQNDSDERMFSYHTDRNKFIRLNPIGENLFLPYKVGEHYMQNIAFIASAMGTKLIDPSTGIETNLYDALKEEDIKDNNGKIVGRKLVFDREYVTDSSYVDTYNMISKISAKANAGGIFGITWDIDEIDFMKNNNIDPANPKEEILSAIREIRSRIVWDVLKESDFMDKCREVNNRLHGIYNSQDKTLLHQNFITNAFASMRNYAFGMVNRRFGSNHYSLALGHDVEGSIVTVSKVFASMFTDKDGWKLTTRAMFLPFSKETKAMMMRAGYSANQYANIRRSGMDSLFIAALAIMKLALLSGKGEGDDEEDNVLMGIAYYFISRILREQMAFNVAPVFITHELPALTNTEFAGLSILTDMASMTELAGKQLVGDESAYYKRSGYGYEEGDSKLFVKLEKLCPYWRSVLVLSNPYESAKSYEWGRRNVGK